MDVIDVMLCRNMAVFFCSQASGVLVAQGPYSLVKGYCECTKHEVVLLSEVADATQKPTSSIFANHLVLLVGLLLWQQTAAVVAIARPYSVVVSLRHSKPRMLMHHANVDMQSCMGYAFDVFVAHVVA